MPSLVETQTSLKNEIYRLRNQIKGEKTTLSKAAINKKKKKLKTLLIKFSEGQCEQAKAKFMKTANQCRKDLVTRLKKDKKEGFEKRIAELKSFSMDTLLAVVLKEDSAKDLKPDSREIHICQRLFSLQKVGQALNDLRRDLQSLKAGKGKARKEESESDEESMDDDEGPVQSSIFMTLGEDNSDSDFSDAEETIRKPVKKKKNRPGQFARRKAAEIEHGKEAKHLLKGDKSTEKKDRERITKRIIERKAVKTELKKNVEKKKVVNAVNAHESWAAAKRSEQLLAMKPSGQSMTFDSDSD